MGIIASDDFNRTAGNWIETGHSGWVPQVGTGIITSALRCRQLVTGATILYRHVGSYPDDYDVGLDLAILSSDLCASGPVARMASGNTYYHGRYNRNGSVWELYRWLSGATTLLGSVGEAIPNGTTRRCVIRCKGDSISLIVDGVTIIGPITDSGIASGSAGLRMTGTNADTLGVHVDNFEAKTLGGIPQPLLEGWI